MSNGGFQVDNRISSTGYVYDGAGDLTQDPNGNTYAYNTDGTLASSGSTQYTYDAMQQRVQKTGGSNPGEFVYFGGHPVAVLNPQTGVWTDLIDVGDHWEGDNLIAEAGAPADRSSSVGWEAGPNQQNFTYRLLDHQGSLAATTDASGNVTGTDEYAPYGQILSVSLFEKTQNSCALPPYLDTSINVSSANRPLLLDF